MEIKVTIKQLGKKHPFLKEQALEIADIGNTPTLQQFLLAVVEQQVIAFNERREAKNVLPFLTEKQMQTQATTGKVGFNDIYNDKKADLEKAQHRMLEAFEDGLFAVFCDEEQLENLEANININNEKVFTFLRLAFLSGSYWY